MLGLGIAGVGTLASFHFAKAARDAEAGLWPMIATGAAWLGALSIGAVALSALF